MRSMSVGNCDEMNIDENSMQRIFFNEKCNFSITDAQFYNYAFLLAQKLKWCNISTLLNDAQKKTLNKKLHLTICRQQSSEIWLRLKEMIEKCACHILCAYVDIQNHFNPYKCNHFLFTQTQSKSVDVLTTNNQKYLINIGLGLSINVQFRKMCT